MKKVLVTGRSGFIGSEIVKKLYDLHDWEITVLDIMSAQIHGLDWEKSYLYNEIKGKGKFIKGDICDLQTVMNALADNEYVLHLAAETGTGQSMYQINQYNEVNIDRKSVV